MLLIFSLALRATLYRSAVSPNIPHQPTGICTFDTSVAFDFPGRLSLVSLVTIPSTFALLVYLGSQHAHTSLFQLDELRIVPSLHEDYVAQPLPCALCNTPSALLLYRVSISQRLYRL